MINASSLSIFRSDQISVDKNVQYRKTINSCKRVATPAAAARHLEILAMTFQSLPDKQAAFEPEITQAMSLAFENVCTSLGLPAIAVREREAVAVRIIELARCGERDPNQLRDHILHEAGLGASL